MLCDSYADKYKNVIVIHQKNMGAAEARNTGVKQSKGKYIFFLDSDDCIDGYNTISKMVECIKREQADIVCGSYKRLSENGVSEVNFHHLKAGEYTKKVDFRFKGFYKFGHLAYNCGKLYRKSFLIDNELMFPRYPFAEDKAHNIRCCAYEPVYAFLDESVFLYRINEESTTFKYKDKLLYDWISIAEDFESFLAERGITKDYNDLMYFHIFFGSFFLAKQELQFKRQGIREAAKVLREYGKSSFVKRSMNALAKGKYLGEIDSFSWKIVIWGASLLFSLHGYWLMAAGIALLRKMEVDSKITKSRYKRRSSNSEG